jgi:hypothetical protein
MQTMLTLMTSAFCFGESPLDTQIYYRVPYSRGERRHNLKIRAGLRHRSCARAFRCAELTYAAAANPLLSTAATAVVYPCSSETVKRISGVDFQIELTGRQTPHRWWRLLTVPYVAQMAAPFDDLKTIVTHTKAWERKLLTRRLI